MLGELADTALAEYHAVSDGERHVDDRDLGEDLEYLPGFVAQPRLGNRSQPGLSRARKPGNKPEYGPARGFLSDATPGGSPNPTYGCGTRPRLSSVGCTPPTSLPGSNPSHCCATHNSPRLSEPIFATPPPSTSAHGRSRRRPLPRAPRTARPLACSAPANAYSRGDNHRFLCSLCPPNLWVRGGSLRLLKDLSPDP
jgi:hypothetical protein